MVGRLEERGRCALTVPLAPGARLLTPYARQVQQPWPAPRRVSKGREACPLLVVVAVVRVGGRVL